MTAVFSIKVKIGEIKEMKKRYNAGRYAGAGRKNTGYRVFFLPDFSLSL